MNEDAKKRYEYLKKKQQKWIKTNNWRSNSLFMEFIQKINEIDIISEDECKRLLERISSCIPFYSSGRINWNDTRYKRSRVRYIELGNYVNTLEKYYVIWDNYDLPAIKCSLQSIIDNVDDIEAVAFDYLIISEDFKVIMESEKFGSVNMCVIE